MDPDAGEHGRDSLLFACDRTRSKEARASLARLLWKPLMEYNQSVEWPQECPLSPGSDILRAQEQAKQEVTPRHWRCAVCGKSFRSEHFLDRHLARKHARLRNNGPTQTVSCLANYCGVAVPCFPLSQTYLPEVSTNSMRAWDAMPKRYREQRNLAETRTVRCRGREEALAYRRVCVDVVEKCVPKDIVESALELAALRRGVEESLCLDAHPVECVSRAEKNAWHASIGSHNLLSLLHTLGWIMLTAGICVYGVGRSLTRNYHRADRVRWRPRGTSY